MKKALTPFNITLLIPTKDQLEALGRVDSYEIFQGRGGDFHPDGLFSVETFGRVGSPERESRFGYIKFGLPIIHPVIYKNIIRLKGYYEEIIQGKAFAVFDDELKDFVPSNELEGETGYHFFFSHWQKIEFKQTKSSIRRIRLGLIDKYRERCNLNVLLVIPAAYREAELDSAGRVEMDEVNELYRKVYAQTIGIPDYLGSNDDPSLYNRRRLTIQNTVVAIYEYFERILSGKNGFVQSKWASRVIFNGTRNVISSLDTTTSDMTQPNRPLFKDAVVGLHQCSRAILPKIIHALRVGILGDIFNTLNTRIQLVDKKTLKLVWVDVPYSVIDSWTSPEGLEKLINQLELVDKRSNAIEVNGHYLALVYRDDKSNFKVIRSIDDVPKGFDTRFVYPITYAELIYLSGLELWTKHIAMVTRYPVENYNSSIPCTVYVKTTTKGELRYPLDIQWRRDTQATPAYEYPVFTLNQPTSWHDSLSLPPTILSSLGAD